jgi:hypothetical protein
MLRDHLPSRPRWSGAQIQTHFSRKYAQSLVKKQVKPIEAEQDVKKVIEGVVNEMPTNSLHEELEDRCIPTISRWSDSFAPDAGRILSRLQHTSNVMNPSETAVCSLKHGTDSHSAVCPGEGDGWGGEYASIAREFLTAYYTDCEVIYTRGCWICDGKEGGFCLKLINLITVK